MIDVKRLRTAVLALVLAPLAACSSVPNPMDAFDFLSGGNEDSDTAPTDGRVSILSFEQTLQISTDADIPAVTLPPAYVNTVWPQPGGYPTHALQHTQASGDLAVAWRQSVGQGSNNDRRLNARPVIADGHIFAGDATGQISARDAETGQEVWSVRLELPNRYDRMSFGSGLAHDSGRVFAHTGFNFFVALDAATGAEVWRTETLVPFHGAPTVADGRVFVTSDDNELLALDAATGSVLWTYQGIVETARLLTGPSPAVLGDIVVAPFASGELVALRVQNGNPVWSDSLTRGAGLTAMSEINDVAGSPVILDGTVYAMSHSGTLVAIELRTGERIWTQPAGGLHTPWVAGDFLYVTTSEAELVCLNRNTGVVHWITQLDLFENPNRRKHRIAWAGPVLAGGRVFLASSSGDGVLVNAYDGEIIRQFSLGATVFVAPVIANETVYVVTDEARLLALR
ncbi:PQQ-binding-like beta-propeller repeat protein [Maricaulis sp.]|mgnify:FL=1|uniref:outer membrane protein assembly factor BamB family protein n=1 Tax=Maricaulis sp. TaxID=1486257 RepID=UPI003A8F6A66